MSVIKRRFLILKLKTQHMLNACRNTKESWKLETVHFEKYADFEENVPAVDILNIYLMFTDSHVRVRKNGWRSISLARALHTALFFNTFQSSWKNSGVSLSVES